MLCILAFSRGRPVARETLAEMLWSRADRSRAQASLRQALRMLRLALDPGRIRTVGGGLALDPATVSVDVARLEDALESGSSAEMQRAAALVGGDFAAGVTVDGEPVPA